MEPVEILNKRLVEHFGVAWNDWAIWRIVWSEDQLEKRFGTYNDFTSEGIFIRTVTEWREVPKYRQWIQNKFVLEQLTAIPEINKDELGNKISYEPIWVFEDANGNALPAKWEAAKLVIDSLYAAMHNESLGPKYVDPMINMTPEVREEELARLQTELFGNETDIGDALAHKQAIVVPHNYKERN